jgi:hypothetical protein
MSAFTTSWLRKPKEGVRARLWLLLGGAFAFAIHVSAPCVGATFCV